MIKPSLILIMIAVLAIIGAGMLFYQGDRPEIKAPERVGNRILKDAVFDDKLKAIDIKKGDVSVRLERKDKTTWVLASHNNRPAKIDRIDQLIVDAGSAKIEGTREGKLERFGLDEKGLTQLAFDCGEKKHALILGKSPDFSKAFVKTDSGSAIYEVDKGLDISAGIRTEKDDRILDPTYFYDLRLLSIPVDSIIDVTVARGKDTVRVRKTIVGKDPLEPKSEVKKDDKFEWLIVEPEKQPADENAVSRITNQFITLNVKKYADGVSDKEAGLDAPTATVTLRTMDGVEHVLTFGRIEGEDVYLALKGRADKFVTYKFTFDNIALTLADLKKKEPPKANIEEPKPAPKPDYEKNLSADEKEKIRKEVETQMEQTPAPKPKSEAPPPPPPPVDKATGEPEPKAPPAVIKHEEKKD